MHWSKLTIFKCLNDFRVAWLSFNGTIEWRYEKFVFGEFFQIANDVILWCRTHNSHNIVFLWSAAHVTESNIQTLHISYESKSHPIRNIVLYESWFNESHTSLIRLIENQIIPRYILRCCSSVNCNPIELLLSLLPMHRSTLVSRRNIEIIRIIISIFLYFGELVSVDFLFLPTPWRAQQNQLRHYLNNARLISGVRDSLFPLSNEWLESNAWVYIKILNKKTQNFPPSDFKIIITMIHTIVIRENHTN